MNIATYSPALALFFAVALLWILMDVRYQTLTNKQKWMIPLLILALGIGNHVLRSQIGSAMYGRLIFLTLHLPVFFLFWYLTKHTTSKMVFMILTAVVFTSPTIIVSNYVQAHFFATAPLALLWANLTSYALILLLAQFVFRTGFNYMLKYGDDQTFRIFSLIPCLYYFYVFSVMNLDVSGFTSFGGYVMRIFPTAVVFVFYFILLHVYQNLREAKERDIEQATLEQELTSAKEQIQILSVAQSKFALFQHDTRHQLLVLEGMLAANQVEDALAFVQKSEEDLIAITPKKYCNNLVVNLLCTTYAEKAKNNGITFHIDVRLPKELAISETELCALLSNGLENAFNATISSVAERKEVALYCEYLQNKLLIEVQNSYTGNVIIENNLPRTDKPNHGYGCKSILSITEQHRGICLFQAENNIFTLRIALPLDF